jgi:hypothetical protein
MKLEVVDKKTGVVVWVEYHETVESLDAAIKDLKQNNFNPSYFYFYKY